jgi:peptide/nickel transport system substrate-binding protein
MDFALQVPPHPYDPQRARRLLAEAGFPNGLDAGEFVAIPGFATVGEAALNNLTAVGIRMRMRPMERASFYAAWQEKKLRGLFLVAVGNSGNAASRVEAFMYSKGASAYGGYPDLDELFLQQARERDRAGIPPLGDLGLDDLGHAGQLLRGEPDFLRGCGGQALGEGRAGEQQEE